MSSAMRDLLRSSARHYAASRRADSGRDWRRGRPSGGRAVPSVKPEQCGVIMHVRQFVERQARAAALRVGPRLGYCHQTSSAAPPIALVAQRLVERLLVDDRGAADIDQERASASSAPEPARVDQPARLRPEPGRDHARVTLAAAYGRVRRADRFPTRRPCRSTGLRLAAMIVQPKLAARLATSRPMLAVAENADRLAEDLAMRRAAGRRRCDAQEPPRNSITVSSSRCCQRQHRHQHVFGDRRLVTGDVADRDAARQRRHVDHVDAGGRRLQQLEPRRRRENRAARYG